MHSVILAAGENRRLWERVPAFSKTLTEVDDKPLLEHLVDLALHHSNRIVIVAAVENVERIRDLLGDDDDVRIVIQPRPVGPGDALLRGLEACDSEHVLVLCGDNVMDRHAVNAIVTAHTDTGKQCFKVGTGWEKNEREALRYTRITANDRFVEGPVDDQPRSTSLGWRVWLGPLVVPREAFRRVLCNAVGEFIHFRIGPHLNDLPKPQLVEVKVTDIGTPESYDQIVTPAS